MPHTPGPWTREPGQRFRVDQSAGVMGPDGVYVAAALDFNRYGRDEEVEDNAHLIAAAPDLLDACQQQHQAIDLLFARLAEHDRSFYPSKSGLPWVAILAGNAARAKALAGH